MLNHRMIEGSDICFGERLHPPRQSTTFQHPRPRGMSTYPGPWDLCYVEFGAVGYMWRGVCLICRRGRVVIGVCLRRFGVCFAKGEEW